MGRLDGKVVLVTGGAGAQGRAIAARMLEEGAQVVVADSRPEALEAARTVLSHNDGVASAELDVTDEDAWTAAIALCRTRFGGLDGLVNAAAILDRHGVEGTTAEVWRRVSEVNELGALLGVKQVVPAMRAGGGGSVVLVSSIDGLIGRGGATAYHASKGAVRLLARTAAVELAGEGIRVNTICPGAMADRMAIVVGGGAAPTGMDQRTPLGRYGEPDDVAWASVYLVSDESSFVTGTDLVVDGGYTAQ